MYSLHSRLTVLLIFFYQESCAEIKLEDGSLEYWEAGSGGNVELMAVKPGAAPYTVPIDHFIKLGIDTWVIIIIIMMSFGNRVIIIVEVLL